MNKPPRNYAQGRNAPRHIPKRDLSLAMSKVLLEKILTLVLIDRVLTVHDCRDIRCWSRHALNSLKDI